MVESVVMAASGIHHAIEAVWRIESARLTAGLARNVRDVGQAEELAQDALAAPSLKQACGISASEGQFDQENDFYTVGKCVSTVTRINHDESIELEVSKFHAPEPCSAVSIEASFPSESDRSRTWGSPP
jgi:hypothetical protein